VVEDVTRVVRVVKVAEADNLVAMDKMAVVGEVEEEVVEEEEEQEVKEDKVEQVKNNKTKATEQPIWTTDLLMKNWEKVEVDVGKVVKITQVGSLGYCWFKLFVFQ
jgi:hypothetical protein